MKQFPMAVVEVAVNARNMNEMIVEVVCDVRQKIL